MSSTYSFLSVFLLGALHALEPGHGKSIVALHTAQSRHISEAFSILASLLLSHFFLVAIASFILYHHPEYIQSRWIQIIAPLLIISYGLFLLIKSRRNSNEYMACACSHEDESQKKTERSPYLMGFLAGLTPCPSVFAPIIMSLTLGRADYVFGYLAAYVSGVILLFVCLVISVFLLRERASSTIDHLTSQLNPHLISGILMISIGLLYFAFGLVTSGHT